MIGHTLAKLFATTLDGTISWQTETKNSWLKVKQLLEGITTIVTFRAIIEQAKAHKCKVYCCFVDFA